MDYPEFMRVKIVAPVWGKEYIKTFVDVSLASQLSENNIPLISKKHKVEYVIYTLKSDKVYLENTESLKLLKELVDIRIEIIKKFKTKDVYGIYGQIHGRELKKSSKINESVFLINSDFVFSDGFFYKTLEEIKSGKKAVNIFCPRANLESVSLILQSKFRESMNVINVSTENLTKVYLKNVHRLMDYHLLPKSENDSFLPSSLMWKAKNGSLFVRNFHFHPILIHPNSLKIKKIKKTIDDGYLLDILEVDEIVYQRNSENYFAIELSNRYTHYNPIGEYSDNNALFFYYKSQNNVNFINYNQQVTIGEIANAELIDLQFQAVNEVNRLATFVLYETSRYKSKIRLYEFFELYRILSIKFAKRKAYIPFFIYSFLRNIHRYIVRDFFRVKNYF
jgi:hypothetical protein